MALKLYRRLRTVCEGGLSEDARSGELKEGRRGWKRCACLIHASGTLGGKFNRKQTGKSDWDEAKALADAWDGAKAEQPAVALQDQLRAKRITIADAARVFLNHRERAEIAPATLRNIGSGSLVVQPRRPGSIHLIVANQSLYRELFSGLKGLTVQGVTSAGNEWVVAVAGRGSANCLGRVAVAA